jgi:hypothetical protein
MSPPTSFDSIRHFIDGCCSLAVELYGLVSLAIMLYHRLRKELRR